MGKATASGLKRTFTGPWSSRRRFCRPGVPIVRARLANAVAGLWRKKRALERQGRSEAVFLFSDAAMLGEASLVDETELGARLRTSQPGLHAQARYMLKPSTAQVFTLVQAWREGRDGGYEYAAVQNMRGFVSAPHLAHVQRFWDSIAQHASLIAPGGAFSRR